MMKIDHSPKLDTKCLYGHNVSVGDIWEHADGLLSDGLLLVLGFVEKKFPGRFVATGIELKNLTPWSLAFDSQMYDYVLVSRLEPLATGEK